MQSPFAVLDDARVAKVLERLHAEADKQLPGLLLHYLPRLPKLVFGGRIHFDDTQFRGFYADKFIALEREQAAFCHLTARALSARVIVEFGTSFGISTIWLASAVQSNGGGRVISSEIVPSKASRAREHIEEAGLYVSPTRPAPPRTTPRASFADLRPTDYCR